MTAEVFGLNPGPWTAPKESADALRKIADEIDAGRVTAMVAGRIVDDEYRMVIATHIVDGVCLTDLIHRNIMNRLNVEPAGNGLLDLLHAREMELHRK